MAKTLKMLKKIIGICAGALLLTGCISQTPVLSGAPTPVPTPSPTLPPLVHEKIFDEQVKDALDEPIFDELTHYARYISFESLRVYEYAGDTFLDGYCINDYTQPLFCSYAILFIDKNGAELARTELDFSAAPAGKSRISAQIDTDMRIDNIPLKIETIRYPTPISPDAQNESAKSAD